MITSHLAILLEGVNFELLEKCMSEGEGEWAEKGGLSKKKSHIVFFKNALPQSGAFLDFN